MLSQVDIQQYKCVQIFVNELKCTSWRFVCFKIRLKLWAKAIDKMWGEKILATLLQPSVSGASAATVLNLFILGDTLTGEPGVIRKHRKGHWINKGYKLLSELWEEKAVFILAAFSVPLSAAPTETRSLVQSHGGTGAFYRTYVLALSLFVFVRLVYFISLPLSGKRGVFAAVRVKTELWNTFEVSLSDKMCFFWAADNILSIPAHSQHLCWV